jgi:hypothetical protein
MSGQKILASMTGRVDRELLLRVETGSSRPLARLTRVPVAAQSRRAMKLFLHSIQTQETANLATLTFQERHSQTIKMDPIIACCQADLLQGCSHKQRSVNGTGKGRLALPKQ